MSGAMTDVNSQPPKRGCNSNSNRRTTSFALQSPVVGRRWSSSNGSGQRPTVRRDFSYPFFSDPSPSCLQQRLATSENQSLLSNGLIKIYHDSLENALCCWLTERTCPYTIDILAPDTNLDSVPQKLMVEEWGSIWSNRICERVCRLDRNASAIRGRPLTQSEDRAASRALQLAIMSFATQWALTSRRSAAEFSTFRTTENDSAPTSTSGSDRQSGLANVRETYWHQARQALHDTADIESFKLVFAHIILSLTQRPLNVDQHVKEMKMRHRSSSIPFEGAALPKPGHPSLRVPMNCSTGSTYVGPESGLAELDRVLDLEGPPLFLETALRQMFSYRCKLERVERQRATTQMRDVKINNMADYAVPSTARADQLNKGDRETFNLLFWLSVMFDTLSSAMNKRPLVVSDEDSDILSGFPRDIPPSVPKGHQGDSCNGNSTRYHSNFMKEGGSNLWGEFFLKQRRRRHVLVARWPCSYEDAAATLCNAAPVKVLFFRKVTRLQTLLSRRARPEKLEETIHDALTIHQHWNNNYGRFILDCVANHDSLPPRVQSWYVILAGHWHLAGLLLADVIEAIDDAASGLESQRIFRDSAFFVTNLRMENAYAVSDLGRCSCPRYDSTFAQAREFHFAVNKGAILTEPWTVVLIRSFSKAGQVLLKSVQTTAQSGHVRQRWKSDVEVEEAKQRCEFCIEGLWHLGKKSDMAFLASTALLTALQDTNNSSSESLYAEFSSTNSQNLETESIRQHIYPEFTTHEPFPFTFSVDLQGF